MAAGKVCRIPNFSDRSEEEKGPWVEGVRVFCERYKRRDVMVVDMSIPVRRQRLGSPCCPSLLYACIKPALSLMCIMAVGSMSPFLSFAITLCCYCTAAPSHSVCIVSGC
jgi:hypothetical protein